MQPTESTRDLYEVLASCATQFHRVGMEGTPTGMDYQSVFRVADAFGVPVDRRFIALLRIWEAEAMNILLSKSSRRSGRGESDEEYERSIRNIRGARGE